MATQFSQDFLTNSGATMLTGVDAFFTPLGTEINMMFTGVPGSGFFQAQAQLAELSFADGILAKSQVQNISEGNGNYSTGIAGLTPNTAYRIRLAVSDTEGELTNPE